MKLKQMEPEVAAAGEYKFYITPFPAFKAANLTGELASVLAPLLGALAPLMPAAAGGENGLMDIDVEKAAGVMAGVEIDGDQLEKLMKKLLLGGHIVVEAEGESGETEPQRLDMDLANELFCGEVQDMFMLCFHVIKLNFNGFFKRFAARSGKAEPALKKEMRKIL